MPGPVYELMVKQLQEEISGLQQELDQIMLLPLEGGTELLDGSRLSDEHLPPVEMLDELAARNALEQQRNLLKKLEDKRQEILKLQKTDPQKSREKKKR